MSASCKGQQNKQNESEAIYGEMEKAGQIRQGRTSGSGQADMWATSYQIRPGTMSDIIQSGSGTDRRNKEMRDKQKFIKQLENFELPGGTGSS